MTYREIRIEKGDNGYIVRYPLAVERPFPFASDRVKVLWRVKSVLCPEAADVKAAIDDAVLNIEKLCSAWPYFEIEK